MRAGIAHHNVDAAERFHGILNEAGDVSRGADVRNESMRLDRLELCERGIEFRPLAAADRDAAAFIAEPARDREPDAAGAAGNEGHLSGKSEIHDSTEYVTVIAA